MSEHNIGNKVGYMCATDFDEEMGHNTVLNDGTPEGTKVFDSLEDLKAARACTAECGYVKVGLTVVERGRLASTKAN